MDAGAGAVRCYQRIWSADVSIGFLRRLLRPRRDACEELETGLLCSCTCVSRDMR